MITPEYLNQVIKGTEIAVAKLNNRIIKKISKRILDAFRAEEKNIIIPSSISDLHKIAQSGMKIEEVQALIENELPEIKEAVKDAFLQSANEISMHNDDIAKRIVKVENLDVEVPKHNYSKVPSSTKELNMTQAEIRHLESAYRRTNFTVTNMTKSTAQMAYSQYINACDEAYMKVKSGVAIDTAITEAIMEMAKQGIQTLTYGSGKTDNIEVAIARAVRTGINQANADIVLTRCAEMGIQFVKVSEHLGARVTKENNYTNHAWWQGKVYKLNWNDKTLSGYSVSSTLIEPKYSWLDKIRQKITGKQKYDYPDFIETCGYGTIEGIIGINCRHTFQAWYPGINIDKGSQIDKKENEIKYKLEQRQRAFERAIRKTKREIDALESAGIKGDIPDNLKVYLSNQIKAYRTFCTKYDLSLSNYRLQIAKGVV